MNYQKEIKKTILFKIATKKYFEINLTRYMKDIYSENCKILMKEIEDDTNKWKDILCSSLGRINVVKMSIPPKEIHRFNVILIKQQMAFSQK